MLTTFQSWNLMAQFILVAVTLWVGRKICIFSYTAVRLTIIWMIWGQDACYEAMAKIREKRDKDRQ